MFRCGFCGENSKHGEKLHRVVVQTKRVQHPPRGHVYSNSFRTEHDPGGEGDQIMKELPQCEGCAELSRQKQGAAA